MKRFFSVLLVALLTAVIFQVYFTRTRHAPETSTERFSNRQNADPNTQAKTETPSSTAQPNSPAAISFQNATDPSPSPQSADLSARAGQRLEETDAAPNLPPEIVLQNVRRVIHQYGQMFGGNPVGTNPEITAALAGQNARHINFLSGQPGMTINEKGELLDAWGTPYFFHQLSGTVMEIRSAGPDKILWNSDDLVTR